MKGLSAVVYTPHLAESLFLKKIRLSPLEILKAGTFA